MALPDGGNGSVSSDEASQRASLAKQTNYHEHSVRDSNLDNGNSAIADVDDEVADSSTRQVLTQETLTYLLTYLLVRPPKSEGRTITSQRVYRQQ